MGKHNKILVTAGYGNQAHSVIPRLAAAGFTVRAMRRKERPGPGPLELGAHEVVVGDATDPGDALRAMEGVDTVYHIGPTFHPSEQQMGFNMIDQAKKAGVGHFIFSSVLHPILFGLPQHVFKRAIEEHLLLSLLDFTILQPSDYMQITAKSVDVEGGAFVSTFTKDNREALVDLDDVAQVVVKVAAEREAHFGATYELSSENLRKVDLARGLQRAFGRPFSVRTVEPVFENAPDIFGDAAGEDLTHQIAFLHAVRDWYDENDFIGNRNVLQMLLGREPTGWEQFCRRHFGIAG